MGDKYIQVSSHIGFYWQSNLELAQTHAPTSRIGYTDTVQVGSEHFPQSQPIATPGGEAPSGVN